MNNLLQNWTRIRVWAVFGLVFLLSLFFIVHRVSAADEKLPSASERLVTIYDQGTEQTIITKAATVEAALLQANITLEASDAVEPAIDEELVAKNYRINVYRARPVLIIDGGSRRSVMTAEQSPRRIVETTSGEKLYDEDKASFERVDNVITEGGAGLKLRIDRATVFQFTLYGKAFEARTQATTVADMLKEKNVTLGLQDDVSVAGTTPLVAGMSVSVWRNGKQTMTQEEAIAKPVEQIKDTAREIGFKEVKTPGTDGKKQVTYEIVMRDGVEISRTVITSVTTLEPIKEVVIVGAKYKGAYTTPSENEAITWGYLIGQGFSREQTAGIMGNLYQEHKFNTTGDGLAQWTGGRKATLMSRPDPYNIYTQLDFMMYELNTGYRSTQDRIRAASSVEAAVVAFQNGYEKCGVCNETGRIQYAYGFLTRY